MHKNFYLALTGIGIGGIGFGLITPVTVLLLERINTHALISGLVTMAGFVGIIFFSRFIGELIERYGAKKILLAGLLLWTLGAFGHILWRFIYALFPIKILMGIGGSMIFVSTEVTINKYSNDSNRGKNIGLYVVVLSVGIAAGTMLIWTAEKISWLPFIVGSSFMFVVFVIQLFFFEDFSLTDRNDKIEKMPLREMPSAGLVSSAVYGFLESSLVVVIPIYGLRNSMDGTQVSVLLTSFVVGGIIIVYILGYLADKISKKKILSSIAVSLSIIFLLPSFIDWYYFLLALFFIAGGLVPAIYTLGLSYTIEHVAVEKVAQANGYYLMMYGIGTLTGPVVGAALVDINLRFGFWVFACILCLAFYFLLKINFALKAR